MGTPGDKTTSFEKVVAGKSTTTHPDDKGSPLSVGSSSRQTLQTSEMGVIGRHLPPFHMIPSSNEPLPPALSKPEIFQEHVLEQASIDDYFGQSKYYSSISEHVQISYPVTPPSRTFQNINQPGPSGLQTFKSKVSSSGRSKKKKQERLTHKKSHPCPICHKSFSTGEKFNKHYQSHSGSTQFKCEHCKKTFTSKFKLVRHALIHSDKKPFSCTVCERTFHRKDHLKNHIKVHSPTKKLYECEKPNCNKQYTSLLSYRKHLAVHAAEEGNLTCQICFISFQNKDEIIYHLKIHAGSRTVKNPNEKKYVCEYCERRFFTKKDVRRHLVVHTGMRDFLCQFCPQRFGRKDHLVRHIKKSHHKQYNEDPSSTLNVKFEMSRSETITSDKRSVDPGLTTTIDKSAVDSSLYVYAALRKGQLPIGKDTIKTEQAEVSLIHSDDFKAEDLGLEGVKTIFEEESLTPLNDEELFLSSQSTQSELKEFCSQIFKQIDDTTPALEHQPVENPQEQILDSQMFNLLQESDDTKIPLPGFSQTFQPPPSQ